MNSCLHGSEGAWTQCVPATRLIIGTGRSAIGTLVERTTRFTMLLHLPRMDGYGVEPRVKNGPALAGRGAEAVKDAILGTVTTLPEQLRRSHLDHGDGLAGGHGVEGGGELRGAVADEVGEVGCRVADCHISWRACWVAQAAVGWAVTPRMCTVRVCTSMTNSAYSRCRPMEHGTDRWRAGRRPGP